MIGRLKGTLAEKQPPHLILDVNGVGYELEVPMTTLYRLPAVGQGAVRPLAFTNPVWLDADGDGKTLWQGGDHGYYASPVLAGDRLLALNEEGSVALLAANPARYAELGQWKLAAGATWTMPAIAGVSGPTVSKALAPEVMGRPPLKICKRLLPKSDTKI